MLCPRTGTRYIVSVPLYSVPGSLQYISWTCVLSLYFCTVVFYSIAALLHCLVIIIATCVLCSVLCWHCCIRIIALVSLLWQVFVIRASLQRYFFFCLLLWGETITEHPCSYGARSVAMSSESGNLIEVELCSMLCSSAFSEHGTEVVS